MAGLLALMLLVESRRDVRIAGDELVPLHEQDRGGWDRALIAEGHDLVRECLRANRPGQYQLLAAINAVHTDATAHADTDWGQIATLYDQLYAVSPTPVVALNRAIAVAELDGPEVALAEVDRLQLTTYHAWHATRADLLRRLGRSADAREAYDAAVAATDNDAERAYLTRRRGSLARTPTPAPGDVKTVRQLIGVQHITRFLAGRSPAGGLLRRMPKRHAQGRFAPRFALRCRGFAASDRGPRDLRRRA